MSVSGYKPQMYELLPFQFTWKKSALVPNCWLYSDSENTKLSLFGSLLWRHRIIFRCAFVFAQVELFWTLSCSWYLDGGSKFNYKWILLNAICELFKRNNCHQLVVQKYLRDFVIASENLIKNEILRILKGLNLSAGKVVVVGGGLLRDSFQDIHSSYVVVIQILDPTPTRHDLPGSA